MNIQNARGIYTSLPHWLVKWDAAIAAPHTAKRIYAGLYFYYDNNVMYLIEHCTESDWIDTSSYGEWMITNQCELIDTWVGNAPTLKAAIQSLRNLN